MSRILQITDTHIAPPTRKVGGLLNTAELFEQAIEKIKDDLPRFGKIDKVIVTGDLSEFGDPESYVFFKSNIDSLGIPYLVIPGNHDCRETMKLSFTNQTFSPGNTDMNWHHCLDDFDLIGLDSCLASQGKGELSPQSLTFLSQALSNNKTKPVLIALHHPPFESGVKFMDKIGLNNAEEFAEVLHQTQRPVRVICGHLHNQMIGEVGGKVAIIGPATISSFKTDYRDNAPIGFTTKLGGYMIHDWHQDGFRSVYVPLEEEDKVYPF